MRTTNKKGFTIVELVIVIAVIAILAAVLIPTFISLVDKANQSSDTQMIRAVNLALTINETENGKCANMTEALAVAESVGYRIENITPASESYILYDSENDRFALIRLSDDKLLFGDPQTSKAYGTEGKDKVVYWRIAKDHAEATTLIDAGIYSVYLAQNPDFDGKSYDITTGLDVGKNQNVAEIKYTDKAGTHTTPVVIRTNNAKKDSGKLTVNAPNGTVYHYGAVYDLTVTAIANESFHEHGYVGKLTLSGGHFAAEANACFHDDRATITNAVLADATYTETDGVLYGVHRYELNDSGKYVCIVCEAVYDAGEGLVPPDPVQCDHVWSQVTSQQAADCTHKGITVKTCAKCNASTFDTTPALGHDFSTEWVNTDSTKHWHACSRCNEKQDEAVHDFGSGNVCSVCEYTRNVQCTDHQWGNPSIVKEADCVTPGIVSSTCSKCQVTSTAAIEALGHDIDETLWEQGATHHWHACKREGCEGITALGAHDTNGANGTCSVCQYKPSECTHSWGENEVLQAADCTHEGITKKTCSSCKAIEITKTSELGHNAAATWVNTDTNMHWHACQNTGCTAHVGEETHSFVDGSNVCKVCGYEKKAEPCTHSGTQVISVQADCTHPGKKVTICYSCKQILSVKTTDPALGHEFDGRWVYTDETHWHACTRTGCAAKKDEAQHSFETDSTVCTACAYNRDCEHSNVVEETLVEPTCTEIGVKQTRCNDCSVITGVQILEPQHEYVYYWNGTHSNIGLRAGETMIQECTKCGEYRPVTSENKNKCGDCQHNSHPIETHNLRQSCPEGKHYYKEYYYAIGSYNTIEVTTKTTTQPHTEGLTEGSQTVTEEKDQSGYFIESITIVTVTVTESEIVTVTEILTEKKVTVAMDNHVVYCKYCGYAYDEPHTYDENGNCTLEGCKAVLQATCTAHTISEWTTKTAATCEKAGEKVGECTKCHKSISESIPATGHKTVTINTEGENAPTYLRHHGTCDGCAQTSFDHVYTLDGDCFKCECGVMAIVEKDGVTFEAADIAILLHKCGYNAQGTQWGVTVTLEDGKTYQIFKAVNNGTGENRDEKYKNATFTIYVPVQDTDS